MEDKRTKTELLAEIESLKARLNGRSVTISLTARRPPGLSTR